MDYLTIKGMRASGMTITRADLEAALVTEDARLADMNKLEAETDAKRAAEILADSQKTAAPLTEEAAMRVAKRITNGNGMARLDALRHLAKLKGWLAQAETTVNMVA
jgi:aconitase B